MFSEFAQLKRAAEHCGVAFSPEIVKVARRPKKLGSWFFTPTRMLAAIAGAGRELRRNPGSELTNRRVPVELARNPVARALVDMLNTSVEPASNLGVPSFSEPSKVPALSVCNQAEYQFARVFSWLEDSSAISTVTAQIVMHSGQPAFIRKGSTPDLCVGHNTAFSLVPFCINNVLYPAASIVRLTTEHDLPQVSKMDGPRIPQGITVCSTDAVSHIAFLRLSCYALSPSRRSEVKFEKPRPVWSEPIEDTCIDPAFREYMSSLTLQEMSACANRGVQYASNR